MFAVPTQTQFKNRICFKICELAEKFVYEIKIKHNALFNRNYACSAVQYALYYASFS